MTENSHLDDENAAETVQDGAEHESRARVAPEQQEARPVIVATWHDLRGIWRMFTMSEWIMRDREGFYAEVKARHEIGTKLRHMVLCSLVCLALYGTAMGVPNGWQQALSSTVKLPLLFLETLLICLPALYFFNLLFGSQLTFLQTTALMMAAITVTSVLTLSFASVTLFLWMSVGEQYTILILLNVVVLAVSSWWGLVFLRHGMTYVHAGASQVRQRNILVVWLLIYAFVGTQMAWSLRPFFGVPGEPFVVLRGEGGTFVESVLTAILWLVRALLGWE
jgi:hypothetical protein